MNKKIIGFALGISLVLFLLGCVTPPSAGTGKFVLLISDAEADISDFESVEVTFSSARVFPLDSNDGFKTIDLTGVTVDLTEVIGEKAIELFSVELEAGTYSKIELNVESVSAVLVDGGIAEVKVPSNKLQMIKNFTVDANTETKFLFDVQVVKKGLEEEYNLLPVISKSGIVGEDIEEEEIEEIEEEEEPATGTGTFILLISDAEADINDFQAVNVTFESARIFQTDTNEGFTTVDLNGVTVDLTEVVGEKAIPIVEIELAAGKYTKIELNVAGVEATLLDGNAATVTVPSDKLKIVKPFTIDANSETKFVFDINIVRKGQTNEYNLLPVIGKSGVIGKDMGEDEVEEIEPEEEEEGSED